MTKKKQPYESPLITETRVELENCICSGSVDFNDKEKLPEINNQQFSADNTSNDFSENSWTISTTDN